MVSQRTVPRPSPPANPSRSFTDRGHGIMRKMDALAKTLAAFGIEIQIGLLIKTPDGSEFTYESDDGMLRNFHTDLPEKNRFRPRDVENLFEGHILACPSISISRSGHSSPLRNRSGHSSPTPSTSSTASISFDPLPAATGLWLPASPPAAETGVTLPASTSPPQGDTSPSPPQGDTALPSTSPILVSLPPAAESGVALPTSPSPPQGEILSSHTAGSSPPLMPDFYPMSPLMGTNLLNPECWPAASGVPFPDETVHRPLPSRPIRTNTPTPSVGGRSRQQSHRVVKVRAPRRKWFD